MRTRIAVFVLCSSVAWSQDERPTAPSFDSIVHVAVRFPRASRATATKDWVRVERPSSGVVLDTGGLVLTSAHLVAEMLDAQRAAREGYRLEVVLQSGAARPASIVGTDARLDLALLQVELADEDHLVAAALANENPRPGVHAAGIGWPDGENRHAFQGAISLPSGDATLRNQEIKAGEFLLCEAALLDQVDGGALCDRSGVVLGLVNTTHVLAPVSEPKAADLRKPDYAIAISAAAIRKTFGDQLPAKSGKTKPLATADSDAVARAASAVVSIWAGAPAAMPTAPELDDPYIRRRPIGLGSGVILTPTGCIATSASLIPLRAKEVQVRLASGEAYTATPLVVRGSRSLGVAFLQLDLPKGGTVPCAPLAKSSDAAAGEWVAVLANPYAMQPLVTTGILSTAPGESRRQVAARMHEGYDGGAVIDCQGRVLAIALAPPVKPDGNPQFVRETGIGFSAALDAVQEEVGSEVDWPEFASDSEQERAARHTAISTVVENTRGSLLNIYVKTAIAKASSGFDPFGSDEPEFRTEGLGSGVVIDEGGLAITNWHVVDSATMRGGGGQREDAALEVSLPDGRSFGARVLSTSRDDDLALLQLDLPEGTSLRPVELGDSTTLQVGQEVITIGNPFGRANTVATGGVAMLNRDADIKGRVRKMRGLIQTDAAVNPGNSGGAMLDTAGRLIGINSAGNGWTTGEGFAIPVSRMKEVFRDKLLSVEGLRSVYLGLTPREENGHLIITRIDMESPAARAGLEKEDVLLSLGGARIAKTGDFARALLQASPGVELLVGYERDGKAAEAKLLPLSHLAYEFARQTGIELSEVDYRQAGELLRDASIALHRAYTGDANGEPRELMSTALRIDRLDRNITVNDVDLRVGDLLLGVTRTIEHASLERSELLRFASLGSVRATFRTAKLNEVRTLSCWIYREGKAFAVAIRV